MPEKKFVKETKIIKHATMYKEVIDLFIFQNVNAKLGEGQYSLYLCCMNGILLYEGIDRRDSHNIHHQVISHDLLNCQLTPGSLDCDTRGQILFDVFSTSSSTHSIRSFQKTKNLEKYDFALDGTKKILKFFNNYVIEVKTEKNCDKISIYDFDNKLSLYNAQFPQIFQIEVETEERKGKNNEPLVAT